MSEVSAGFVRCSDCAHPHFRGLTNSVAKGGERKTFLVGLACAKCGKIELFKDKTDISNNVLPMPNTLNTVN